MTLWVEETPGHKEDMGRWWISDSQSQGPGEINVIVTYIFASSSAAQSAYKWVLFKLLSLWYGNMTDYHSAQF